MVGNFNVNAMLGKSIKCDDNASPAHTNAPPDMEKKITGNLENKINWYIQSKTVNIYQIMSTNKF